MNLGLFCLERMLSYRYFNLWKTFYLNFRLLPFTQAIRFPIIVWGSLRIISLFGRVRIDTPVKTGMIHLGFKVRNDMLNPGKSVFHNDGLIIVKGEVRLYNGYYISNTKEGVIEFGKTICANNNLIIICNNKVTIGDECRFAFGVRIMTSDVHFSVDMENHTLYTASRSIMIGNNNWITSDVKIMKGTVTPNWTIVTSGSFLNKDYTRIIGENCILGGQPARLIKEGQRRVFSQENEDMLRKYFIENPEVEKMVLPMDIDLDKFCKI